MKMIGKTITSMIKHDENNDNNGNNLNDTDNENFLTMIVMMIVYYTLPHITLCIILSRKEIGGRFASIFSSLPPPRLNQARKSRLFAVVQSF